VDAKAANEIPFEQTISVGPASVNDGPGLARALGLFDMTLLVMGTVIGAGIFTVPADVVGLVHSGDLALAAWAVGGIVAISGGLVYAELAGRRPHVGGQYIYLREAYHPVVAFLYGWSLLCVVQSGGMAAVAVIFGRYFSGLIELVGHDAFGPGVYSVAVIAILTFVNCLGVRAAGTTQNIFMTLKIAAILMVVVSGLFFTHPRWALFSDSPIAKTTSGAKWNELSAFGAALVSVLFAYGGWHTATFVAGEVKNPRRTLPLGLVFGVSGVIALYLAVNYTCLAVLGTDALAATNYPATVVMKQVFGDFGAVLMSVGVTLSTIGFVSQAILTSPRVYYVMARQRLFLESLAWVHPRTRVPVVAILLQGGVAIVIAVTGTFDQIVKYVMSVELVFLSLTALSLFAIRRHDRAMPETGARMRGHPVTTLLFVAVNLAVLGNLFYKFPLNSALGLEIALVGYPVYIFWRDWYARTDVAKPRGGLEP
jgi:basic amino acid/polyamine antiporter, APA family